MLISPTSPAKQVRSVCKLVDLSMCQPINERFYMAVHKKFNALGRGLDALISTENVRPQGSSTINEIPLEQIEAPTGI